MAAFLHEPPTALPAGAKTASPSRTWNDSSSSSSGEEEINDKARAAGYDGRLIVGRDLMSFEI